MSSILLVSPSSVGYGAGQARRVYLYPPIGLCYVASVLRQAGHTVGMLDASLVPPVRLEQTLRRKMKELSTDAVGVTATTPQIAEALDIVRTVKAVDRSCLTIVGGPHATAMPDHVLACPDVDLLVRGEGEETVVELFEKDRPWSGVLGISHRVGNVVTHNPRRPLLEDLDALPYPAFDLLEMDRYGDVFLGKGLGIASSRGCPYDCSFCSKDTFGRRVRLRSRGSVAAELAHWSDTHGIRNFFFQDEVFTVDQGRAAGICREIIDRRMDLRWHCTTRANLLSRELMSLMRDAGCVNLGMGVESADPRVLRACDKDISTDDIRRVVRWANELGLKCQGFFVLGLPHETRESIQRTIAFMCEVGFDYVSVAVLVPLPNTRVWDLVEQGEVLHWRNKDFAAFGKYSDPVIELPGLSAEDLKRSFKLAYRRFYLNPRYFLRQLRQLRPSTAPRMAYSFLKILKFMR